MSNKYENLIKLYYKKQNIEEEYIKRIENPATFITNIKINPIKRGNKILDKEYKLFYVNLTNLSKKSPTSTSGRWIVLLFDFY